MNENTNFSIIIASLLGLILAWLMYANMLYIAYFDPNPAARGIIGIRMILILPVWVAAGMAGFFAARRYLAQNPRSQFKYIVAVIALVASAITLLFVAINILQLFV